MHHVPRAARVIYFLLFLQACLQVYYLGQLNTSVSDGSATRTRFGSVHHDLHDLLELEVLDQYRLHANFMRRGQQVVLSDEEIELTFKYWEFIAWLKNFPNFTLPMPYDFGNRSLWEPAQGGDKILTQIIWRLQLIIGNYVRKYLPGSGLAVMYPIHTIGARPKRIFMGHLTKYWEDWPLLQEWRKTKRIHHCEYPRNEKLPEPLADSEPVCELVDTIPSNWSASGIDLIATHQIRSHPLEGEILPDDMPWFKFSHESPWYFPIYATRSWQFVNSYWSGSPVQQNYAKWVYYNPYERARVQGRDYSVGKYKMVAMLVSNCNNTHNGRVEYARELQKYISVDIYGSCGDLECKDGRNKSKECFQILQEYKFYLAFENSNCQEYVTEKLHKNAFENNLIPIVMGAPPEFYLQHAPQNSYIHVQDFESPKILAKYLKVVSSNATMYNSYFQWKGTGELIPPRWPWLCIVCSKLYSGVPIVDPTATKFSATHWIPSFKVEGKPFCLPKNQWYW